MYWSELSSLNDGLARESSVTGFCSRSGWWDLNNGLVPLTRAVAECWVVVSPLSAQLESWSTGRTEHNDGIRPFCNSARAWTARTSSRIPSCVRFQGRRKFAIASFPERCRNAIVACGALHWRPGVAAWSLPGLVGRCKASAVGSAAPHVAARRVV